MFNFLIALFHSISLEIHISQALFQLSTHLNIKKYFQKIECFSQKLDHVNFILWCVTTKTSNLTVSQTFI